MNEAFDQFVAFLKAEAEAAGHDLLDAADDVAEYAAARAQHLSTLWGQPGFNEALKAERDNVALKAGIKAVEEADAADDRIRTIIEGAVAFAASAARAAL